MNAKEFKEEILAHYLDEDLQVTIDRNPTKWSTGNGLLYTSFFYTILALNNAIDKEDSERFSKCVDLCWEGPLNKPIQGLLERNDGREDLEAHDDYHVVTASFLLKTYHAKSICYYGDLNCWSYNNVNPGKFSFNTWHYRFLGQIAYYQLAAKSKVNELHGFFLKQKIKSGPGEDDAPGALKDYLKCQVMLRYPEFANFAHDWLDEAKEEWGSLGEICAEIVGKTHPFIHISTIDGVL